jgi:hypothetical protein
VSEHLVNLDENDTLTFKFVGASKLTFSMSYEQVFEAALQSKLQEMHKSRYCQGENSALMQMPMAPIAGRLS